MASKAAETVPVSFHNMPALLLQEKRGWRLALTSFAIEIWANLSSNYVSLQGVILKFSFPFWLILGIVIVNLAPLSGSPFS